MRTTREDVNDRSGQASGAGRKWARSGDTQRRIIEASVEVFSEQGFAEATVAAVVARSGVSTGSIYHHFGGKGELFLAIWDELSESVSGRMESALAADPDDRDIDRFESAVRAYLWAMWELRKEAMVLASGDAPKGFETIRRKRMLASMRPLIDVLGLGRTPRDRLITRFVLAVLGESAFTIAGSTDRTYADMVVDQTVSSLRRLDPAGTAERG